MTDVVAVGETMALLSAPEVGRLRDMRALQLSAAGSESNVAIGVRRLGYGSAWIGKVGGDELGELILDLLRREGVDLQGARREPSVQTAVMVKERRTAEVTRVSYYRRGFSGSRLAPEDLDEQLIGGSRILHVTGILLGLSESARASLWRAVKVARAEGVQVSFDLNYRAALWGRDEAAEELGRMAEAADLVFGGEEELALLGKGRSEAETAAGLLQAGVREVVVKRGAGGASVVTREGMLSEPAVPVTCVDPVGAGDAFVAGYLAGVLDGVDAPGRLQLACATGAFAVSVLGDWEGLPSRDDLSLLGHREGTTLR